LVDGLNNKITDKKSGINIYIYGKDIEFTPTKKQINDYINQQVKLMLDEFINNNPDVSEEDINYQE
jgi:hypothetical protein